MRFTEDSPFSASDMGPDGMRLMRMPKDVVDGVYQYSWPEPGGKVRVELVSGEDRRTRFFLDIHEARRTSRVVVGVHDLLARKAKSQVRAGTRTLVRVDYTNAPETMVHTNPDGTVIVGPHVHFWVDGYNGTIAVPIGCQGVLVPRGGIVSAATLLEAMLRASSVTERLAIAPRLEV